MFLTPLFGVALLAGRFKWRVRLASVGLGVFGILLWLVPSVLNCGGLVRYIDLTRNLTVHVIGAMFSPFSALSQERTVPITLKYLTVWTLGMLWPLLLPYIAGLFVRTSASEIKASPSFRNTVLLWASPPILFYLLNFIPKPGYVLTYFTPLIVFQSILTERIITWVGLRFGKQMENIGTIGSVGLAILLSVQAFLVPLPSMIENKFPMMKTIATLESETIDVLETLKKGLSTAPPEEIAVFCNPGSEAWRKAMYYVPDMPMYHLLYDGVLPVMNGTVDACVACHHRFTCAGGDGFSVTLDLPKRVTVPVGPKVKVFLYLLGETFGSKTVNGKRRYRIKRSARNEIHMLKQSLDRSRLRLMREKDYIYAVINVGGLESWDLGPFHFVRGAKGTWAEPILSLCSMESGTSKP
jgi:hypothetical protein